MFLPLTFLVDSILSIYQTIQSNKDVYHSVLCNTAKKTSNGEHLNEPFYEAPYFFVSDSKTHIFHLFFTLNVISLL